MTIQYTGRRMKRNHANAKPRYIIAINCEPYRTKVEGRPDEYGHSFRLGNSISCRIANNKAGSQEAKQFDSPGELRRYIYNFSKSNYTTWVIAHGMLSMFRLAEFPTDIDAGIILPDTPRSTRKRETNDSDDVHCSGLVVLESPPTIIAVRCMDTGGRIVFVDTLNWFCVPLRELNTACGTPEMTRPAWDAPFQDWSKYCINCVETVYHTFLNLIWFASEHKLGNFAYTAASQSMRAFRHGRMPINPSCHDNMMVKDWERAAYFGGRSEVFRWGEIKEECHHLDVNSLFPSIMAKCEVPIRLDEYYDSPINAESISETTASKSVARCLLETSRPWYPVRRDNFVCYPIGRYWTCLCGNELALAKRSGHIREISQLAVYQTASIFGLFVQDFWNLRKQYQLEGNDLYNTFCKMILNSLYGKFAQRAPRWQPCEDIPELPDWGRFNEVNMVTGEIKEYRKFGKYTQENVGKQEKLDSFVAISAFITSAARMRMNSLRQIADLRNVFYQGVDSLIVNNDGYANLETAGEVEYTTLGKMRLEYSGSPTTIYGVSDYRMGERVIMAGRPSHATQIDDSTWLATILGGCSNLFRGVSPVGMRESQVRWTRADNYRKGATNANGWVDTLLLNDNYASGIANSPSVELSPFAKSATSSVYAAASLDANISEPFSNTRKASSSDKPNCERTKSLF